LSFFDEDDEPRRSPRPRRGAPAGGVATDRRTLLLRQALLIGGFVLFLVFLFFVVSSCADSRKKSALRDYNREVAGVVRESDTQVGDPFFALLANAGEESPQDLQTNISGYRIAADTQLKQARAFDVPGDMEAAQRSLLIALEFRRDGLGFIAERIRTALGDAGTAANTAITQIAGQMQVFLASDVIYEARVAPLIKRALANAEITGQRVPDTQFLPGTEWLSEQTVAARLGQQLSGGSGSKRTGTPAPGLHGTGLDQVSVGQTKLNPDAPNRLPAAASTAFVVRFANQGENDEFDVRVVLRVEGGPKPLRVAKTVDTVARGQTAEVTLELGQKPPTGTAVTVEVEIAKVPGEEKVDNNKASYDVLFTDA
jgi:hypothetical protein